MSSPEASSPSIADVARVAQVSTATVSRVLNRPESVRPLTRIRVETAITQLGYLPHASARALMLRRTGTVGAVFPTVDNPFFAKGIDALQARLAEKGYHLLIATCNYDVDTEMRQALNLLARGVDALVFCGQQQRPELLQQLRERQYPFVHVMVLSPDPHTLSVGFDNAAAIGRAVHYLTDLGHSHIAMLAGITRNNDRATARVAGVRAALHALGLELPTHALTEQPYTISGGRTGLRQLLCLPANIMAPTAVLCGNDLLAFGALLEAQRLGLKVPEALSIIGFDDLELAQHLQPGLTTIHVPTEKMWSLAADRILARINGEILSGQTEVEATLIVRDSTGPAPCRSTLDSA